MHCVYLGYYSGPAELLVPVFDVPDVKRKRGVGMSPLSFPPTSEF